MFLQVVDLVAITLQGLAESTLPGKLTGTYFGSCLGGFSVLSRTTPVGNYLGSWIDGLIGCHWAVVS